MKKNFFAAAVLVAVLLAGCGAQTEYITVGEATYPADAEQLDLRDREVTEEEYEQLQALLPDCEILWRLPFQGEYLDLETEELEIRSLTAEEAESLCYLKNLKRVNAEGCRDLAALELLQAAFPDCTIQCHVDIGGQSLPWDTDAVSLAWEEVPQALEMLPRLRQVTITETVSDRKTVLEWMNAWPEVTFHWNFALCGVEVSSDAAEVDLSGIALEDTIEVEGALECFNHLEKLILCDTGLSSEELDGLWKRHPETRVIWNVKVAYFDIRTDATTLMPFQFGYDGMTGATELKDKHMTEMQYLVDMVCMDLGHQGMTNIEFVRNMPNLKYLIIADTPVTDLSPLAELKNLEYLEVFLNGLTDISPLAECTGLRDVNLCFNNLTDITPLLELPELENIWLSGNLQLSGDQRQLLAETFPEARIEYNTSSSTGGGWRELSRYYEQRELLGMDIMVG